jgi:YidC/Oxa1 family membrane protein insertase
MAQQQQNPRSRLTTFLITYLILFGALQIYMYFFAPKPPAPPGQVQSVLAQARELEAAGRKEDPNVSLADRKKKLEQAIGKYEEFYNQNKTSPEGVQARFQQVNIYDYLARLEGEKAGTHWYDQAEHKLKDMENAFHGKTGEVQVEQDGQVVTRQGNLAHIATERLDAIRAARDQVNQNKWTYRSLDFFVRLTGSVPAFSYFFALLLIVVVLKVLTFPFQKKQYEYQRDMMRIQPKLKALQEEMKGRPQQEVSARTMELFKENNVSLAGGCLPMLVMVAVLFPVFYMVRDYEYQFTNATFLWIGSELSKQYWWIADNLAQFDIPLFVIYLLSTMGYSLLQPKPADPQQAQQQKMMMYMMPIMFGVFMFMYKWSSAFMLYWLILNIVSMYQSWVLMKRFGLSGGAAATAGAGAEAAPEPAKPLETMQGLPKPQANGRNGKGGGRGAPGRVKPRGSGRRG